MAAASIGEFVRVSEKRRSFEQQQQSLPIDEQADPEGHEWKSDERARE
jgi:hypothetical protein